MNIILCGFKNSGKTTVGKILARDLHYRFDDTDALLEEYYRRENNEVLGAADIYTKHGQEIFRQIESDIILKLEKLDGRVIALGGGSVLSDANIKHLHEIGQIIYLRASKKILKGRMNQSRVPGFIDKESPDDSFEKVYQARYQIYEKIADRIIDVDGKRPEQIAKEIINGE
ncbi:MAG: shikimate kinase [Legionellales bacterium]|jgi:shikimate kinase